MLASAANEVTWRNATSLAYYAAFHRCLALAQHELPGGVPLGIGHRPLVEALKQSKSTRLVSIAYMLEQCRQRRTVADYRLDVDFTQDTATTVLEHSRRIFRKAG